MAEKTITYKIKVVNESGDLVEKEAANMKELSDNVGNLEKELQNAQFGSEKFKKLSKAVKQNKDAIEEAKNSSMSFTEKLQNLPGPLGGVIKGAQGLNKALLSLVANPIGAVIAAVVLAVTALYKAFASTKAGAEKLDQIFAGISAAMDVLRDRVLKVGSAITKFFSGDFSGALDDAKGAVSGIGDEIAREFQAAADATKKLQEVEDATRTLNVERAKQNALISEAKGKINDENLSYAEREAALEQVRQQEISLAQQEQKLAEERYKALKALADLSDSSKEQLDELAAAEADMYNKQKETADKQKELADQQKTLRDKRISEAKAAAEKAKREAEELQKFEQGINLAIIEDDYQRQLIQTEQEKQAQLEQIKNLKTSEEHKAELRLKVEQATQIKLDELAEKKRKDDETKAKEEQDRLDAQAQKELDRQMKQVDALLALDAYKYEEAANLSEDDLNRTLDLMRQKTDLLLQNEELTYEERLLLEAQYNEAVKKLQKDAYDAKKALDDKIKQDELDQAKRAADALGLIAEAAGEQTLVGQAAAVAQATISTYLAATEAYAAVVGVPGIGPALAVAAAASAVALGLKNIQQIMSVDTSVPKPKLNYAQGGLVGGQGSGTMDNVQAYLSPGESVINARSTSMFRPLLSAINEAGGGARFNGGIVSNGVDASQMELLGSIRSGSEKPLEAYVVSTEMTSKQMLDRQIKSRSLI